MRYSTLTILFKYLKYYWVAENSKGHGVHSPFVFKLIQTQLSKRNALNLNEEAALVVKNIVEKITATAHPMSHKTKHLIAQLVQRDIPVNFFVLGENNLNEKIESSKTVDFVFIGGDLSIDQITNDTALLFNKMHANSWIILQNIHASSTMEAAWENLKAKPAIRLTIDLFDIGILFCRKEQKEKEHFIIRY